MPPVAPVALPAQWHVHTDVESPVTWGEGRWSEVGCGVKPAGQEASQSEGVLPVTATVSDHNLLHHSPGL